MIWISALFVWLYLHVGDQPLCHRQQLLGVDDVRCQEQWRHQP